MSTLFNIFLFIKNSLVSVVSGYLVCLACLVGSVTDCHGFGICLDR